MRRVVVDASVVVKWLLPEREGERDVEKALHVLQLVKASEVRVYQPPHWLAEASAVVSKLSPATAREDIEDLCEIGFDVIETREVYVGACDLSCKLNHHLFDTLYHAVALVLDDAFLITADERYYRKAEKIGHIILLENIPRAVGS
ncbi:MAG: type II toxin-antitoxin system VapC family toxin [Desulfoferrobacter sp.]